MKNLQMINAFSKGAEYAHLAGPPVNEDYVMLMVVIAVEEGVVSARKVWDEGDKEKRFAISTMKVVEKKRGGESRD